MSRNYQQNKNYHPPANASYKNSNARSNYDHNQALANPRDALDAFQHFHEKSRNMFREMERDFFGGAGFGDDFFGGDFGFGGGMLGKNDGFGGIFEDMRKMMDSAPLQLENGNRGNNLVPRKPDDNFGMSSIEGFGPGTAGVAKTFVYSKSMGEDGKPHEEKYYSNRILGQSEKGEKLGELEEMYENSRNREKRMAKERVLNDQGRRVVKRRIGDQPEETKQFYRGINESQASEFDKRWQEEARTIKNFTALPTKINGKSLGYGGKYNNHDNQYNRNYGSKSSYNNPRAIGYGSRR